MKGSSEEKKKKNEHIKVIFLAYIFRFKNSSTTQFVLKDLLNGDNKTNLSFSIKKKPIIHVCMYILIRVIKK